MKKIRQLKRIFLCLVISGLLTTSGVSYSEANQSGYIFGKRGQSPFYVVGSYESYRDISTSLDLGGSEERPGYVGELGFRVFDAFSFFFVAGQSINSQRTAAGIGMRVNTPGFLFIGGRTNDLKRKSRNRPFNSSLFGSLQMVERKSSDGTKTAYLENVLGMNLDIFIVGPLFVTLGMSGQSSGGDYRVGLSGGLGLEF